MCFVYTTCTTAASYGLLLTYQPLCAGGISFTQDYDYDVYILHSQHHCINLLLSKSAALNMFIFLGIVLFCALSIPLALQIHLLVLCSFPTNYVQGVSWTRLNCDMFIFFLHFQHQCNNVFFVKVYCFKYVHNTGFSLSVFCLYHLHYCCILWSFAHLPTTLCRGYLIHTRLRLWCVYFCIPNIIASIYFCQNLLL